MDFLKGPELDALRAKVGRRLTIERRDGEKLVVIRSETPEVALAAANKALADNDKELFDRIPEEAGQYRFVGYFAMHGKAAYVVDAEGNVTGELEPGDSIVSGKALTFRRPGS